MSESTLKSRSRRNVRWQFDRLKRAGLTERVQLRDSQTCRCCGFNYERCSDRFSRLAGDSYFDVSFPYLTIDHIVPLSQGGTNSDSNLQTLCSTCNGSKGGRKQADWKFGKKMREHLRIMAIIQKELSGSYV